jgi:hypothetical protein
VVNTLLAARTLVPRVLQEGSLHQASAPHAKCVQVVISLERMVLLPVHRVDLDTLQTVLDQVFAHCVVLGYFPAKVGQVFVNYAPQENLQL